MGIADELERLKTLRDSGAMSSDEYERAKQILLSGGGASPQPSYSAPGQPPVINAPLDFFKIRRSVRDRWLGGVCGGLAEVTPVPSWAWRLIFCFIALGAGTGVLLYLLAWIFIPPADAPKYMN